MDAQDTDIMARIDDRGSNDPEKPPSGETGAWSKPDSKTIDRIVEWLIPVRSERR